MTFVHCEVKLWSPSVHKKLTEDWGLLKRLHGGTLFALHSPGDRKHEKFLNLFGFEFVYHYDDDLHGPTDLYKTKE